MKKPEAKKLPSGAWFVQVRITQPDGTRASYPFTGLDKDKVEAEAFAFKAGILDKKKRPPQGQTLTEAIDQYIASRQNVLSPATIRGYRIIQRNRFQGLMNVRIDAITPAMCQRAVNQDAARFSGKTVKNSWGFVSSVIAEVTGQRPQIRLPQVVEADEPWLDPEEIKTFCKAIEGQNIEIPALLALSSLRRSELLALTWENIDFERETIKVAGSVVPDEQNAYVTKQTNKNRSSRRVIPFILPQLKAALEAVKKPSGRIVTMHPDTIRKRIDKVCRENNLPEIGIHGLRRSFASLAYSLGVPEAVAMEIGGWSDIYTMHRIYVKLSKADRKKNAEKFTAFFTKPDEKANEKANEEEKT